MLYSGTDPESYITDYDLVYEEKRIARLCAASRCPVPVLSGDTTPCRMTGVTLRSHVRYNEI